MPKQYYKFLYLKDGKITSDRKDHQWEIGKEYSVEGDVKACYNGFHASELIQDALWYVNGDVLAIVEGSGDCDDSSNDKVCFRNMKIVKAYKWTTTDSVTLAIYAAEQVVKIYEDKYPTDSRPRDAIKAAKAYLKDPSKKKAADAAADAAYAARAADAAAYAAYAAFTADAADAAADAAYAARAAADAAYAAFTARAAADAAYAAFTAYAAYAARAARAAAYAAAYAARAARAAADAADAAADAAEFKAKMHRKIKSMIKNLEQIK